MAKYLTKNLSKPTRGIDLKSSENNRTEDYLTNAQNVMYDINGNICKRNGSHTRIYGIDVFSGLARFDTTDYKGVSKSELLILGNNAGKNPVKVVKNTFSITNTLIAGSVTFTVLYDEATLQYRMVISGTVAADIALGLGVGDLTLAGLIAALPLTQTGVASGVNTIPAAYLEMKQITIQPGEVAVFEYYTTAELVWGGYGSAPTITPSTTTGRTNPSYAIIAGSIYWYANHTGVESVLYKYDGASWYEAGLGAAYKNTNAPTYFGVPKANGDTVTDCKGTRVLVQAAAGSITDRELWVRYSKKDLYGAMHYGEFSKAFTPLANTFAWANGGYAIQNQDPSILPINTINKNARCAIVDGDQTTLTLNVHAGHTLRAGDIAYFWYYAGFAEREIISITATSITLSATPIVEDDPGGVFLTDILDHCVISNNFRLQIWVSDQTLNSGGDYRITSGTLHAEVPVNTLNIGANYIYYPDSYGVFPEIYRFDGNDSYEPPKGLFIADSSNGSGLIVSGNSKSTNTVYSSSSTDNESFILGRNSFVIDGDVSALGSSGSVSIIGTANKTYAVTGDIPSLNFRVEKITDNMGISGPSSVAEVDEGSICFNTHRGMFSLAGGRDLNPVGAWPSDKRISIIEPFFTYRYSTTSYAPNFGLAKVSVIKEKKLIINAIPSYFGTSFYGPDTVTWVYDYSMGGWFIWTGVDFSLGCAYWDDKVWIASQGSGGKVNLSTMNDTNTDYDYSDHGTAIESVVQYAWESGGNPNVYKKFLWLTVYTPSGNGLPYELNVRTWANYEITKTECFNSPTALHTEFYKYATPPGYTMEAKLKSGKLCSLMLEIGNNNANEGLWIAGTEMDIAPIYATPSRSGRSDT